MMITTMFKNRLQFLKVIAVVALTVISIPKQAHAGDKMGVRAGYALGWWSNSDAKLKNFSHSPYVGFVKMFGLVPTLKLGTGIDYQMNGYRGEEPELSIYQHNADIPLYLRLKLGPFVALGGVHSSFAVYQDLPNSLDNDDLNRFDWGPMAGLGFNIAIVTFDARVMVNQHERFDDSDVMSRMVQVGATIVF